MFHSIGIIGGKPKVPHPVGEQVYVSGSPTGNWTCPADVTSVCVVLIGKGGNGIQFAGSSRTGGGGGALTYKNNIAVVPGQDYAYSRSGSATMFGLVANQGAAGNASSSPAAGGAASSAGSPDASFSGSNSTVNSSLPNPGYGGAPALYTADASPPGYDIAGRSLFGPTGGGTLCGDGGSSVYTGSAQAGGVAGIRIMWGDGRSFPDNAA